MFQRDRGVRYHQQYSEQQDDQEWNTEGNVLDLEPGLRKVLQKKRCKIETPARRPEFTMDRGIPFGRVLDVPLVAAGRPFVDRERKQIPGGAKKRGGRQKPDCSIDQQRSVHQRHPGILFERGPVTGGLLQRRHAKGVHITAQPREFLIRYRIHQQRKHDERDRTHVGRHDASGNGGKAEKDRGADEDVGQCNVAAREPIGLQVGQPESLRVEPGHKLSNQHAEQAAEIQSKGEYQGAEKSAVHIAELPDRSRKEQLRRVHLEITHDRVGRKRNGAKQHKDGQVAERHDHPVGRIDVDVLDAAYHRHIGRRCREERYKKENRRQHVDQILPPMIVELEFEDVEKH